MADDDDTIYIDVEPRLNDSEAERVTGRLRDKFKGAGTKIGDALGSELGQELQKQVGGIISDRINDLAKNLGEKLGSALGSGIRDIASSVGVDLGGIADTIGSVQGKVQGFADSFKDFKSGDVAKGVGDLAKALDGLPGPLGSVADKSSDLLTTYGSLKGNIKDVSTLFGEFEADAPGIAGALGMIGDAAGPLAAGLLAVGGALKGIDELRNSLYGVNTPPPPGVDPNKWYQFNRSGGSDTYDLLPHGAAGGGTLGDLLGAPPPAAPTAPVTPGRPGAPTMGPSTQRGAAPGWGPVTSGGQTLLPGVTQPSDLGGLMGGAAHTSSAFTGAGGAHVTLADSITSTGGLPPGVGAEGGLQRDTIRAKRAISALFPQITSIGGYRADPNFPDEHPSGKAIDVMIPGAGTPQGKALGDQIRDYVLAHSQELGVDYALWQQRQWNPGGTSSAMSDRGGITQNHMDHVHIHTAGGGYPTGSETYTLPGGGGGFSASPTGFGVPGLGGGGLGPLPPPTQGNQAAGPISQQQMGTGKGVGVSGGGLIGMGEQAATMAAAAFGFGAGGIAAQAAEQEMNLAIQKGGQMAAVAASILPETAWLGGGQLGAPTVSSPMFGWPGKILGGLIGQQTNLPNIAGAVQPPKQPQQKEEEQQGQQGAKGQSAGPTGAKDDPMHVNVTNQPPPPQGAATSGANMTGVMSGITV